MQNDILFTPLRLVELETLILNQCRKALSEINPPPPAADPERWMNLQELCEYLPDKPKVQTVYSWVSNKLIPYNKGSKHLRFLKSEIDTWLKSGRRKTLAELQAETFKRGSR
ncbi:MAG TPA: helix-turn-helix domain-containing protein [Prolixibacteraceae bacterium]